MSLFKLFKKKSPALLVVRVNGKELCAVYQDELPTEKTPSVHIDANSNVTFIDSNGTLHDHMLGPAEGWSHFSIRVHASQACQADCVVSDSPTFDATALAHGKATGIRFQPFFLSGASVSNAGPDYRLSLKKRNVRFRPMADLSKTGGSNGEDRLDCLAGFAHWRGAPGCYCPGRKLQP